MSVASTQRVKLGDVLTLINGRAYRQEELLTSGTPVIRIQNLNGGDRWFYSDLSLPEEKYCEAGDLLFAWSATFGPYFWNGPKSIFHYHIWKVLPSQNLDKGYAYHMLQSITERVKAAGRGISMIHMTKAGMEAWEVDLPPLDEQKRIAAILDKADALRAKRRQAIALLDSLTQSIFLEMFGDPVSNPRGFKFVPLADLVDPRDRLNYGVVQPGDDVEGGVPLIRVSDLQRGMVDRSNLRLIDSRVSAKHSKSVLKGTEILISCVGSIGEIALASKADKGSNVARAVARVPLKADVSREFVATYLRTDRVQQYFTKELRTVSQPTLNIKQILETPVPLVVSADADKFESRLRSVRRTIYNAEVSNTYVSGLFASLQHRAFCGQL